jgi:hypothetical protein
VLGLVIGGLSLVAAIWIGLRSSKSIEENYNVIVFSALIFGLLAIFSIYYILRETFSIQRAFLSAARERDTARDALEKRQAEYDDLSIKESRLREHYTDVAPVFNNLSRLASRFETQVSVFNTYIISAFVHSSSEDHEFHLDLTEEEKWKNIDVAYRDLLRALCDAAVKVLPLKRDRVLGHSANIKVIEHVENPPYRVLERSSGSHSDRYKADEKLKTHPVPVIKNRMYHHIILNREQNPWCIVPDIEAYLQDMEKLSGLGVDYKEPTKKAADFYKSCLVVPITAERISSQDTAHQKIGIDFNENTDVLLGFFCIDCEEANFFDAKYDLEVMSQLANHAAGCIRSYFAVEKVRSVAHALDQHHAGH